MLEPSEAEGTVGTSHSVTLTMLDTEGDIAAGYKVTFWVEGANPMPESTMETDGDGRATFSYTGTRPGDDRILVCREFLTGNCGDPVSATMHWYPVNEPPVVGSPHGDTTLNQPVVIDVMVGAHDPDGGDVSFDGAEDGANGSVDCTELGECTYTPTDGFAGDDSFKFTVRDDEESTTDGTATVTVNRNPEANDDVLLVPYNGSASVNVLANDSDPDGDTMTAELLEPPPAGGKANCDTPMCTFESDPGWWGSTTFTYEVSDGHDGTDEATVHVTVAGPPNDPPNAVDDVFEVSETTPTTLRVLANDSDPDGDEIDFLDDGVDVAPQHGTVTCENRTCTYDPVDDYKGLDSFRYAIADTKGEPAFATVILGVDVNVVPVALPDEIRTVVDVSGSVNVLVNDSDSPDDKLDVELAAPPVYGTATCKTPVCTFEPDAGWSGVTGFSYVVSDGRGGSAEATVRVIVTPENQPPFAANDSAVVQVVGPTTLEVLANDRDVDGDAMALVGNDQPDHGTATCSGTTCTYDPYDDYVGDDSFTYTIKDEHDLQDTATVTLGVGAEIENLPPQAKADEISTEVGLRAEVDVVENDVDPDGDELAVSVRSQPRHGSVDCADHTCTYTPEDGFSGIDDFMYTVADPDLAEDSATVTVNVATVNEPVRLTLTPASTTPGGTTVVDGQGCDANEDVAIRINDRPSAAGSSDGDGDFRLTLKVPVLDVGRHRLVAQCGLLAQAAPLDIAVVSTAPAAASSTIAVVLSFFVLLGLVVFQSPSYRPLTAR